MAGLPERTFGNPASRRVIGNPSEARFAVRRAKRTGCEQAASVEEYVANRRSPARKRTGVRMPEQGCCRGCGVPQGAGSPSLNPRTVIRG